MWVDIKKLSFQERMMLEGSYDLHRNLTNTLLLRRRDNNTLWQYFPDHLRTDPVSKHAPCDKSTLYVVINFALSVVRKPFKPLCNYKQKDMTRYHFTCLSCRTRKFRRGKIDNFIAIVVLETYVHIDRKRNWLKDKLLHAASDVVEATVV
jgi:hypothetical protein